MDRSTARRSRMEELVQHSDWAFERPPFRTSGGMVAAKAPSGAKAGAEMLSSGGNAVDAAVTAALVSGVVEPYMSGIGGGGHMLIHLHGQGQTIAIDYAMPSPKAAKADMYELLPGQGRDEYFGWRQVRGSENIDGPRAVGVPGTLAGLSLALERYGTQSLATVVEPAIRYAEQGFDVSWFDTLMIAQHQHVLRRYEGSREIFLPGGDVPAPDRGAVRTIRQPALAATLRALAAQGPAALYQGEIGQAMVSDLAGIGGVLTMGDLESYRPLVTEEPTHITYRGHEVYGPRSPCGSTTVLQTLRLLEKMGAVGLDHNSPESLDILAQASRYSFADRYALLGNLTASQADYLLGEEYANQRAQLIQPGARPTAFAVGELEDSCSPDAVPGGTPGTSTTHISVVDEDKNVVSLTQTLLRVFGSGMVLPETGVLMNNAMSWFDPVPGGPCSVAPSKRPMTNMSPMIVLQEGQPRLALGATGGRRIMQSVLQILLNVVDHGMEMQAAVSAPRIDCSGTEILANARLGSELIAELRQRGHSVVVTPDSLSARNFASPACIGIDRDTGSLDAGLDPYYPAAAWGI